MKHNLFTREIIANFIETHLKYRLSTTFIISRREILERFNTYAQDIGREDLRMYALDKYSAIFAEYYDRQSELLAALMEYSSLDIDFSYITTVYRDGYYNLEFFADPLNLTEWKKFISCIKGENKHDGEQEAKS